jgi:hypothetical protein
METKQQHCKRLSVPERHKGISPVLEGAEIKFSLDAGMVGCAETTLQGNSGDACGP